MTDELTPERVTALTAAVDIEASPPDGEPVALVLFGTNQAAPAQIAAARYHAGAAPLVIATGGINRHNGIVEGRESARQLIGAGVPGDVIRVEDQSKDTWQNVELSLPYLREALAMGLRLAVVSKWYHLRTIYCLATLLPEAAPFHAISWEPVYAGALVTRASWPKIPDGRRRVLRESQEVPRRVAEGTYRAARTPMPPRHSVTVSGVIPDGHGRVLLIRRRDNQHWEPPGGVLELGETIHDGLRREIREETGLDVEPDALTGVYKNMPRGIIALVFRCKITADHLATNDEVTTFHWADEADIRQLTSEAYAVRLLDALHPDAAPAVRQHDGVHVL